MTQKQKNRRKKPATRKNMGGCQGLIIKGGRRIEIKIVDQEHGGLGIVIPKGIILRLGDELKVEFPLMTEMSYLDKFKVVEVNNCRVGLKYADNSSMSPKQRWDTWMVKVNKEKEKRAKRATKAPPKGFANIRHFVRKLCNNI